MSAPAPVVFDLDGTLADSRPGIVAAINQTLRALGLPERGAEELQGWIGPPLHETFSALLDRPPEAVEEVVEAYRGRYAATMLTGTVVYPGVVALLDALAGRPLAVATSKAQPLADALLAHLGLAGRFVAICGPVPPAREDKAGTLGRALDALRAAGHDPAGAALVGDRHHDVDGAHAHGLRAIGALWGYGTRAELGDAGADALAPTPADVPALL